MYKFKQGYIANKQLKKIVSILQDEVDINWHITKMVLDQDFSETDF
jgi:hypothetical protein